MRELSILKRVNSRLTLGVFYSREGMLAEAEREFQTLVEKNPQLLIIKRLTHIIRTWQPLQSPR